MKELFRPWPLFIGVMICFMVWCWFSMSGIDYQDNAPHFGYRTAGWFILGFPFLLGLGLVVALGVTFVARRAGNLISWTITAVAFGILISNAVVSSLPGNRLSSVVNVDASSVRIYRLMQMDSFNGGITTFAMIQGDDELFDRICQANKLRECPNSTPTFFNWLHDGEERFFDPVTSFENDQLTCYNDIDNQRIYIRHCWRSERDDN